MREVNFPLISSEREGRRGCVNPFSCFRRRDPDALHDMTTENSKFPTEIPFTFQSPVSCSWVVAKGTFTVINVCRQLEDKILENEKHCAFLIYPLLYNEN